MSMILGFSGIFITRDKRSVTKIFYTTRKYKNVKDGNNEVAMVIDDLESVQPWRPRGIKISGNAERL